MNGSYLYLYVSVDQRQAVNIRAWQWQRVAMECQQTSDWMLFRSAQYPFIPLLRGMSNESNDDLVVSYPKMTMCAKFNHFLCGIRPINYVQLCCTLKSTAF